jgi:hypothetical protein
MFVGSDILLAVNGGVLSLTKIIMTLPIQDLAEGAPYELPEYGRVEIELIDENHDLVFFRRLDTLQPMIDMVKISMEGFREDADPLPIAIEVPTSDHTSETNL